MDIYLTKDGKSVGPFNADELREKLKRKELMPDESAWSAETGDWKRLELVLEKADSLASSSKRKASGKLKPPPPSAGSSSGAEAGRQGSSKLRPPMLGSLADGKDEGSGKKKRRPGKKKDGGGATPVTSAPTAAVKAREAQLKGAASSGRLNPLRILRWLGVLAFAGFLFSLFLPWVSVINAEQGWVEINAIKAVTASASEMSLPGTAATPKHLRTTKILFMAAAAGAILVLLTCIVNAKNEEAETSSLGVVLAIAVVAALGVFGFLYGRYFESEFNDAAMRAAGGGDYVKFKFQMDGGFYFAIAAVLLMAATLALPQKVRGALGTALKPAGFLFLVTIAVGAFGLWRLGSRGEGALQGALGDIKSLGEKVGDTISGADDAPATDEPEAEEPEAGEPGGDDDPFAVPDPPADAEQ